MTEVLWPTLGRALNFYTHFLVQNGSTFEVPVTFSPEVRRFPELCEARGGAATMLHTPPRHLPPF